MVGCSPAASTRAAPIVAYAWQTWQLTAADERGLRARIQSIMCACACACAHMCTEDSVRGWMGRVGGASGMIGEWAGAVHGHVRARMHACGRWRWRLARGVGLQSERTTAPSSPTVEYCMHGNSQPVLSSSSTFLPYNTHGQQHPVQPAYRHNRRYPPSIAPAVNEWIRASHRQQCKPAYRCSCRRCTRISSTPRGWKARPGQSELAACPSGSELAAQP